jgi:thioredoxin 1
MKSYTNVLELESLISSNPKVVVDFYSDWCGPCKKIAPFYENKSKEYPGMICVKADAGIEEIAQKYEVSVLPTFVTFHNGLRGEVLQGANTTALSQLMLNLHNL